MNATDEKDAIWYFESDGAKKLEFLGLESKRG